MTRAEVIERLRSCADDPMWADHAEVSKVTLAAAIEMLSSESTNLPAAKAGGEPQWQSERPAAQAESEPCWCEDCNMGEIRMFVCPDCGCKRCPRAGSHEAGCTGKLVPANTPSGVTHTCSGCEENRAQLDAAVKAATPAAASAAQAKNSQDTKLGACVRTFAERTGWKQGEPEDALSFLLRRVRELTFEDAGFVLSPDGRWFRAAQAEPLTAYKLVSLWFGEWELILPPDARQSFIDDLMQSVRALSSQPPSAAPAQDDAGVIVGDGSGQALPPVSRQERTAAGVRGLGEPLLPCGRCGTKPGPDDHCFCPNCGAVLVTQSDVDEAVQSGELTPPDAGVQPSQAQSLLERIDYLVNAMLSPDERARLGPYIAMIREQAQRIAGVQPSQAPRMLTAAELDALWSTTGDCAHTTWADAVQRKFMEVNGIAGVDWVADAQRHAANEWADMATNGIQWVKNIRDGISTPEQALESLARDLEHCREVSEAARGVKGQEHG